MTSESGTGTAECLHHSEYAGSASYSNTTGTGGNTTSQDGTIDEYPSSDSEYDKAFERTDDNLSVRLWLTVVVFRKILRR